MEELSANSLQEEANLFKSRLEERLQELNPDMEVDKLTISEETGLVTAEVFNHYTGDSFLWEFCCEEDSETAKLIVLDGEEIVEEYDIPNFIYDHHAIKEANFPSYVDLSDVSYLTEDLLENLV